MSAEDRCWNCGKVHEGPCDDDWVYGWLAGVVLVLSLYTIALLAATGVIA